MQRELMLGLALAGSIGAASAQDAASGEAAFKKCQVCHDVGEGARNKLGPILNGLDGRKAGTVEGYNYSEANKSSDIIWSEATFKEYLIDPSEKMPGTKMMYSNKNEQENDDLWAYLKQFGSDGKKK
jgi:cytochrome c